MNCSRCNKDVINRYEHPRAETHVTPSQRAEYRVCAACLGELSGLFKPDPPPPKGTLFSLILPREPQADSLKRALGFLGRVAVTLVEKERGYGAIDSDLRIFAPEADPSLLVRTRIDQKLERIKNLGPDKWEGDEDTLLDLVGYLALLAGLRDQPPPTDGARDYVNQIAEKLECKDPGWEPTKPTDLWTCGNCGREYSQTVAPFSNGHDEYASDGELTCMACKPDAIYKITEKPAVPHNPPKPLSSEERLIEDARLLGEAHRDAAELLKKDRLDYEARLKSEKNYNSESVFNRSPSIPAKHFGDWRPDPGDGYRLLKNGELIWPQDECFDLRNPKPAFVGSRWDDDKPFYRRNVAKEVEIAAHNEREQERDDRTNKPA